MAKNFSGWPMPAKARTGWPAQSIPIRNGSSVPVSRGTGRTAPQPAAKPSCASAGPIERTRSARARPVATGSRSGPAGRHNPLPKPRAASTTTIDRSLATPGFWNPSSSRIARAPAATAARAPAARSRAIQVGPKAARSSGSSPTSAAVWRRGSTRTGPSSRPPYPRETTWAAMPRLARHWYRKIAVGVLPVPPALRLPMQITGTPGRSPGPPRASRRAVPAA